MARIGGTQRAGASRRGRIIATPLLVSVLVAVLIVAAAGVALGSAKLRSAREAQDDVVRLALPSEAPTATASGLPVDAVEVPALEGLELAQAEMVLSAAGLDVKVHASGEAPRTGAVDLVGAQDPQAGVLVDVGTTVTLSMRSSADTTPAAGSETPAGTDGRELVVCIDPGHQGRSDSSPEPIGPKSKKMKTRASGGATGVTTKLPEYEIALQISMNLKRRLEGRGIRVIMTRTTDDVNISNAERAIIGNKAKADLFVRVHGNGSPDSTVSGVSVIYPAKNHWTVRHSASSKRAARRLHSAVVAQTGAVDRGMTARGDHAGFNWSRSPAVLVECGFLSNSVEDRLLASPHYQDKLAEGIAAGVSGYLAAEGER